MGDSQNTLANASEQAVLPTWQIFAIFSDILHPVGGVILKTSNKFGDRPVVEKYS